MKRITREFLDAGRSDVGEWNSTHLPVTLHPIISFISRGGANAMNVRMNVGLSCARQFDNHSHNSFATFTSNFSLMAGDNLPSQKQTKSSPFNALRKPNSANLKWIPQSRQYWVKFKRAAFHTQRHGAAPVLFLYFVPERAYFSH
jgi:hypothetical protein